MYHFLLFIVILIYIYEFVIYIAKVKQNYIQKRANLSKENFNNNNLLKYGFYPSNYGDNLNYYLNPPLYSMDKNIKRVKPVGTMEDLYENPGLFIKLTDQYPNKRKDLPSYWKCQRSWFDCTSHLPYDLDSYYNKNEDSISEERTISEGNIVSEENIMPQRANVIKNLIDTSVFEHPF